LVHPLVPYGWDDRVAGRFTLLDVAVHLPGRVVRVDRGSCLVATADGLVRASPYALVSRRAGIEADPATGDWVALVDDPQEGAAVVGVVPRWSAISRKDPDDRVTAEQVLAANIDVLAVVCGLDRTFAQNRLERMLAVAWESGALPVVVLTKADVLADLAGTVDAARAVAGVGVTVHVTSSVSGQGIEEIRALLDPQRTLALIGPSGVGKSSLVNQLVGADVQSTGAVRAGDSRGRHTTSTRDLVPVPSGGVLLDTPGLRSLPLWDAASGVATTFADIEDLASGCRFRDCVHEHEPGCAVRSAVDSGELGARRLESYHKLVHELAALELRQDERARRAASRRFGRMTRDIGKQKPGRDR
jgi:ribosome biogenesis GTPase